MGYRKCTRCSRSRSRRRLRDCRAIPAQFSAQFLPRNSRTAPRLPLRLQAKTLNANKLARFALEKLAQYKVPVAWQEQVDLFALSVRGRPLVDAEELLPSCFRCQVRRRGPSLSRIHRTKAYPPSHRSPSLPLCFRCQTINPLLNQNGDKCIACGHPFIRSFVSFEGTPRHRPATRPATRRPARHRV